MRQQVVACAAALLFLSGVPGLFAAPPERPGRDTFSKLVVVGDSLAAGVENGSLVDFQQEHGFAKVIARQMHVPLSLPLVPYPGAPNTSDLVDASFPPVIKPLPGYLVFPRLNPFEEVTDVAVPLQTVSDALNRKPNRSLKSSDETQLATNLVLGFPCPVLIPCPARTQVQQAVALRPTAILINIGNNDILAPVTSGQLASILTSPIEQQAFFTQFATNYALLLQQLSAARAPFIIGNLPDVIETAFFIPVPKVAAELKLPVSDVTTLLGVNATDFITLSALPKVEAIVTNQVQGPLPASCSATATPAPCVVTAQEAAAARAVVMQLNQIIVTEAAPYHAVMVDLFHLVDQLYVNGYTVGNRKLTSDFLGGLFSLDGIHPTNTGYAIMANEFIKAINQAFDLNVRSANVREIAERDPLVLNKPFWRRFR
ncbi:MAG TPA: SGNH/GDSL hydrolase family protein [Bryobacteraceae bacterium]|nr:SGNH/GDSL hydrolase family protein [Bryobacteraceae bacterium]